MEITSKLSLNFWLRIQKVLAHQVHDVSGGDKWSADLNQTKAAKRHMTKSLL